MVVLKKLPYAEPREFDAPGTYALALSQGVRLRVPRDEDVILAAPIKEGLGISEELADNITRNKQELMRFLLLKQAYTYLNEHAVEGFDPSVFGAPGELVDEAALASVPMKDYRQAIRAYVQAGLKEFARTRSEARSEARDKRKKAS